MDLEKSVLIPTLPLRLHDLDLDDDCVAEEVIIRTDLDMSLTPCPVDESNSGPWTDGQRLIAKNAYEVEDVDDFRQCVSCFFGFLTCINTHFIHSRQKRYTLVVKNKATSTFVYVQKSQRGKSFILQQYLVLTVSQLSNNCTGSQ